MKYLFLKFSQAFCGVYNYLCEENKEFIAGYIFLIPNSVKNWRLLSHSPKIVPRSDSIVCKDENITSHIV